jgi:16S rRNA (guanine527-N7)-methyltransferase
VEELLLDSLLFLEILPHPVVTLLDLGSGVGVPGIPLKIVMPDLRLTMIESRRRRASFLSTAVRELALSNTRVVNARAEEMTSELAGSFDAVVMRCAGRIETLLPLAERFVRSGGVVAATGPPRDDPPPRGEWRKVRRIRDGQVRKFLVTTRL